MGQDDHLIELSVPVVTMMAYNLYPVKHDWSIMVHRALKGGFILKLNGLLPPNHIQISRNGRIYLIFLKPFTTNNPH